MRTTSENEVTAAEADEVAHQFQPGDRVSYVPMHANEGDAMSDTPRTDAALQPLGSYQGQRYKECGK